MKRFLRSALTAALVLLFPGLGAAQLELEVTANPDPARNGEIVEVVVQVGNASGSPQADLTVQLDFPVGFNAVSEATLRISDGGDCPATACEGGEVITWTLPTLAPGQGIQLYLTPVVATATADGTQIPVATRLLQAGSSVVQDSAQVTVSAAPVLELALDGSASPVAAGGMLDYTLTFGNEGATTLTDVTLRLPLPAGTAFVSASDSGVQNGSTIEWTLPVLGPAAGSVRRARVSVGALASGSLLRASGAEIVPAGAPASAARASTVTRVLSGAPLALVVVANPDPVKRLEDIVVELTVSNLGATTLFDVAAQLRVPFRVSNTALSFHTPGVTCVSTTCDAGETASWPVGNLAPGQAVTVVFATEPPSTAVLGEVLEYRGRATATGGASAEAAASALVLGTPALDLALVVDRDPVLPLEALTYSLYFGNESASTLADVSLELPLPAGTQFVSASDGGSLQGGSVRWALGTLGPRSGDVRRVRVAVGALASGALLAAPAARLVDSSSTVGDARASAATRVAASAPLRVQIAAGPDPVDVAEFLLLEVAVANTGVDPILNARVELRVPYGVIGTPTGDIEGAGLCLPTTCDAREILTWSLGTLLPGQVRTLAFAPQLATATATSGGQVLTVAADVRTSGPLSASAAAALLIDDAPLLDVSLDPARDPARPLQPLDLVLGFGNKSNLTRSLRLELPLPAGATFVSASNGGKLIDGAVRWDILAVPTLQGGKRSVRLQLGSATGLLDFPPARLFDLAVPLDSARATAVVQVEETPALSLAASVSPDPAPRLADLDVDFEAGNDPAAVQIPNVTASVQLPFDLVGFLETLLVPLGGICLATTCDEGELVTWSLGQLDPGASQALSLPPTINSAAILGGHLRFRGRLSDPEGRDAIARYSVRVGSPVDTDGDGILQYDDNCPVFANLDQTDTDLDGRGNACECTDQNGDGRNTVSDLVAINLAIFNPGLVTPLCDGNNDGACNVNDIIAANIEIFSPTNTSTCARQSAPGP